MNPLMYEDEILDAVENLGAAINRLPEADRLRKLVKLNPNAAMNVIYSHQDMLQKLGSQVINGSTDPLTIS